MQHSANLQDFGVILNQRVPVFSIGFRIRKAIRSS